MHRPLSVVLLHRADHHVIHALMKRAIFLLCVIIVTSCGQDAEQPSNCAALDNDCNSCLASACCSQLEACLFDEACLCAMYCARTNGGDCVSLCNGPSMAWGKLRACGTDACTEICSDELSSVH